MFPRLRPNLILVDTDALIWRYGLTKKDNTSSFHAETRVPITLEEAKFAFTEKLEYLKSDMRVSSLLLALPPEGSVNFRYSVYPDYKKHREEAPAIIGELKAWVRKTFAGSIVGWEGVETDDILADLHRDDGSTILVSNDKDMLQLPGWNLHPFSGDLNWVNPKAAALFLWYQILAGDNADGYLGCPGIGEVKAIEILLKAFETHKEPLLTSMLADVVAFTYLSQGSSEETLRTMWRLAKIGKTGRRIHEDIAPMFPKGYNELLKEITNDC